MTYKITSNDLYEVAKAIEDGTEEFLCIALGRVIWDNAGCLPNSGLRVAGAFVEANRPASAKLCGDVVGGAWDVTQDFKINWALQQAARLKREELLAGEAHD